MTTAVTGPTLSGTHYGVPPRRVGVFEFLFEFLAFAGDVLAEARAMQRAAFRKYPFVAF
jgi:hypothetical protein